MLFLKHYSFNLKLSPTNRIKMKDLHKSKLEMEALTLCLSQHMMTLIRLYALMAIQICCVLILQWQYYVEIATATQVSSQTLTWLICRLNYHLLHGV